MASRIFMYLFIFSALLIVFQYANSKRIIDTYENDITSYKAKIEAHKKTITDLEHKNFECNYFSINHNEEALTYFENRGYNTEELIPIITDGLYAMNIYNGEDHPIVPYVSMTGSKLIIDTIKVLNHKWIIANFTDGEYWGELFLTYEIDATNNLKYKLVKHFMYPKAH